MKELYPLYRFVGLALLLLVLSFLGTRVHAQATMTPNDTTMRENDAPLHDLIARGESFRRPGHGIAPCA